MSFVEEVFPVAPGYGTRGGPGFSVSIIENDAGKEERVSRWDVARRFYDVSVAARLYANLYDLQEFYVARRGPTVGFRFEDPLDHNTSSEGRRFSGDGGGAVHAYDDVVIGVGDGSTVDFQLFKVYQDGTTPRNRTILKPVSGTVLVGVNGVQKTEGVDYTVNHATGVVTFGTAPPSPHDVTAGFEFHTPVRFGDDTNLEVSADDFSTGGGSVTLVELLDGATSIGEGFDGGAADRQDLTVDVTISLLEGRLRSFDPQSGGLGVKLPDVLTASLPYGGPLWIIENASGVNSMEVQAFDGTTLTTLAAGDVVSIARGKNDVGFPIWTIY